MPVASAEYSCMPPKPNIGRIATVRTMIPIPPNHCISERQNRVAWLIDSMFVKIVAPVVVNPDIVSKNASVKFGIAPLK